MVRLCSWSAINMSTCTNQSIVTEIARSLIPTVPTELRHDTTVDVIYIWYFIVPLLGHVNLLTAKTLTTPWKTQPLNSFLSLLVGVGVFAATFPRSRFYYALGELRTL
jgi:hypothetical protein